MAKFAVRKHFQRTAVRIFKKFSINRKGKIIEFERPQVMGILNITPDSFYCKSRTFSKETIASRIHQMLDEGVDIIDIGAYSTRPGANDVGPADECRRIAMGLETLRGISDDILVSVDTFRASVAHEAVTNLGADIINDVSGGDLDPKMIETVASLNVPYILTHMRGTPETMTRLTQYNNVTADVIKELSEKTGILSQSGVNDIIIDPGFGFSKTTAQNYELIRNLEIFHCLEKPLLVGFSRKSMIYTALNTDPHNALNGTTILNTIALLSGVAILRVHDVKEAREAIELTRLSTNQ